MAVTFSKSETQVLLDFVSDLRRMGCDDDALKISELIIEVDEYRFDHFMERMEYIRF